ncbi:BBP7 family outer membrane beta-barrel protein [Mariniblastus sp.]|nr:BBP7 family outer membrane beta-barrel protein [Mariniblastus sp.]
MKRFWHACFAVIASTAMIGTANAQWNQSPEIGSYQSILSRTGYGSSPVGGAVGSIPGALPSGLQNGMQNAMPGQLGSGTRNMAPVQDAMQGQFGSGTRNVAPMQDAMQGQIGSTTHNMAPPSVGSTYAPQQVTSGCSGGCGGGGTVQYGGGIGMNPVVGDAHAGAGSYGGGSYGGGVASYADMGAGCSSGSCGDPVYTPGASIGGSSGIGGIGNSISNFMKGGGGHGGVNRVGGVFGVVLRRNYEDPLRIGSNAGQDIFSDDIRNGDVSGVGASLASRKANGNGSELVYWGLDDEVRNNFTSPDFFSIGQLDEVALDGQTVFQTFNNANNIGVFRDMEINNFEANLLRNGGNYTTRRGKSGNFELLGGFRLFQFDESLRMIGNGSAPNAATTEYRLEAQNFLLGGQLGARNEVCLTKRLRLTSGVNVGVFNNRSETRQRVFNQDGVVGTVIGGPADGRDFDYSDTQDDIAVLGELKVGLAFQVSQSWRYHVGYQVLGVGGVALAADQVPLNTLDPGLLSRSRTNQTLLLQGLYFGGQTCF